MLDGVFVGDTAEISPEARDRLRRAAAPRPGSCPTRATFLTLVANAGPAGSWLAQARSAALKAFFAAEGLCSADCEFTNQSGGGAGLGAELAVSYGPVPDDSSPSIGMRWSPSGEVRRGDTVRVEVTVADTVNAAQSGVRSILFERVTETGALTTDMRTATFPPPTARDCSRPPPEAQASFAYPVTAASPRLIRILVSVSDHAGNVATSSPLDFRIADLTGIWLDTSNGHEVAIDHAGSSVTATYLRQRECDHRNGTGAKSTTSRNFDGVLGQGRKIEGQMTACRFGDASAGFIDVAFELAVGDDWATLEGVWFTPEGDVRPIGFSFLRDR